MTKQCAICHATFKRSPRCGDEEWDGRKFCSRSCAGVNRRMKTDIERSVTFQPKTCGVCQREFTASRRIAKSRWVERQFCSLRCAAIAQISPHRQATVVGEVVRHKGDSLERLMAKIQITPSCWIWKGQIRRDGYGNFRMYGKTFKAHRASYILHVGEIPAGLEIDHLCRNRTCVNPKHLEPVTKMVNFLRGESPPLINIFKTHCPKGHPYDAANTYIYPVRTRRRGNHSRKANGGRYCRACNRQRVAEYQARKRGAAHAEGAQ